MPRQVKIKRETPRLKQWLSGVIGEGLHTSFRKCNGGIPADNAWYAIKEMNGKVWCDICLVCARTTIKFGLQRPSMTNSIGSRSKLAFLLAKISVRKFKHYKHKGDRYARQACEAIHDMTFKQYRKILDTLADQLVGLLIQPHAECADCRCQWECCRDCKQPRCPIHCSCAAGEKPWPKKSESKKKQRTTS